MGQEDMRDGCQGGGEGRQGASEAGEAEDRPNREGRPALPSPAMRSEALSPPVTCPSPTHQAVMRYWARAMETGEPVMVTCRSPAPSAWFPILICAPDICRISLILLPWRPITQPISWGEGGIQP